MSRQTGFLNATVYRAHNPRWSFVPTSGAGAAKHGGRFNRPGVPALYTSSTYELAIVEAQHGLPFKLQPLTIVSYRVQHDSVLDLSTQSARSAAGVTLNELACAWELAVYDDATPPSWTLADRLIAHGIGAIIVPSFASGGSRQGHNVVFWQWQTKPPQQVAVVDDDNRLPHDGSSWGL